MYIFYFIIQTIKIIPLFIFSKIFIKREILNLYVFQWINVIMNKKSYSLKDLYFLYANLPEFRSVLYYLLKGKAKYIQWIAPGMSNLYINCPLIGTGLVIQHGFSTIINAKSIGCNCQIWQNVTIGVSKSHMEDSKPTIGNNVKICANSVVIGNITIGNNVIIGAGAIVTKDIPDDCTVVGNPAHIVHKNL